MKPESGECSLALPPGTPREEEAEPTRPSGADEACTTALWGLGRRAPLAGLLATGGGLGLKARALGSLPPVSYVEARAEDGRDREAMFDEPRQALWPEQGRPPKLPREA